MIPVPSPLTMASCPSVSKEKVGIGDANAVNVLGQRRELVRPILCPRQSATIGRHIPAFAPERRRTSCSSRHHRRVTDSSAPGKTLHKLLHPEGQLQRGVRPSQRQEQKPKQKVGPNELDGSVRNVLTSLLLPHRRHKIAAVVPDCGDRNFGFVSASKVRTRVSTVPYLQDSVATHGHQDIPPNALCTDEDEVFLSVAGADGLQRGSRTTQ
jgi:hypothetical protein